jgi:hypothetical protein
VRRLFRLACFAAAAGIPEIAGACSIPPPPPPPPQSSAESDAEFAARRDRWYGDLAEKERKAALPGMRAHENRLWATARRVVLARIAKVGSTRLRGSEGQWYRSPVVTLRPIQWLKGYPSPRRIRVHYLSDDSCLYGGAGDAPDGEVGELFILFYKPGPLDPRYILDTLREDRAVTARTRQAFRIRAKAEGSPILP